MPQHLKRLSQDGFTGIELLMVLTIVVIVALLVTNNIQEALAKGRDIERRTEINALQSKLEEYWHANESYPTDLADLIALGISPEALSDPNGNPILIAPVNPSSNKPASSYTRTSTRPEQEYTYAPYNCRPETSANAVEELLGADTDPTAAESPDELTLIESAPVTETPLETAESCQSYVLYSWLEKAEADKIPFEAINQHNTP